MQALFGLDPEITNDKYASICLANIFSVSIFPFSGTLQGTIFGNSLPD